MRKLLLFLFLLFNITFVDASNLNSNECIVKDNNPGDFFSCIEAFTSKEEDSFGEVSIFSGISDVSVSFIGDKIIYKNTTHGYVTKCTMSIGNKSKFIADLQDWSKGNFSSENLSYSECEVTEENENNIISDSGVDMSSLFLVEENPEYTIFKGNNRAYIYTSNLGIEINGKVFKDSLCEISTSNGEGLKKVGEYIVDNTSVYFIDSYIDYGM